MRQCLALLMLCVLLLSHGSMGEAVPHLHAHDFAHVDVHHDDEAVSHDVGETDVEIADAADSNRSDDGRLWLLTSTSLAISAALRNGGARL